MSNIKQIITTTTIIILALSATAQQRDIQFEWIEDYQVIDARREIRMPQINGYQTIKADFHMHTYFSDGHVTPQTRVIEAWREGLDAIAITDHSTPIPRHLDADYNTSYKMAQSTAASRGITLIHATEYTQREPVGHLNFLFIEDANKYAKPASELPYDKAIEMAADEGGFVILNHPGWPDKNSVLDPFHIDLMERDKIHAVEVVNGDELYPLAIDYSYDFNLAMMSTTDLHSPVGGSYNHNTHIRNLTLIFADDNSEEAIKDALFEKRTLAYANNLIIGRPDLLTPFFLNSFTISNLQQDETRFSCNITNHTDITWYLYGPEHRRVVLPANRTIRLSDQFSNADLIFNVKNTWVTSGEHLQVPLSILLANSNDVLTPYIRQDLNQLTPGTPIEIISPTTGSEVFYTLDGSEPTQSSAKYNAPFVVSKSSTIRLRAFKEGMNPSRVLTKNALLDTDHPATRLRSRQNGINYTYYEGPFLSTHEFETKGELKDQGVVTTPDITIAKASDHFGFVFSGFIYAPTTGEYSFALNTDDGSLLKMAGIELVNNDGSHSLKRVDAKIRLERGYHPFELRFFDDYDEEALNFLWTIPGQEEAPIAPEFYFIEK
jgi:predicted metal-dependent phosphoesterase TrpH